MTPKEKANELVDMFQYKGIYITDVRMSEECAIEIALMSVDEMIEALRINEWQNRLAIKLYEEVKEEINKL